MGEPATPTPAEVAATLARAREIIDAVRNDTLVPTADVVVITLGMSRAGLDTEVRKLLEHQDDETFRLAQDLVAKHEQHAKLVAAVIEFRDRDRLNYRCPFPKPCGDCPSCRIERVANIALGVEG